MTAVDKEPGRFRRALSRLTADEQELDGLPEVLAALRDAGPGAVPPEREDDCAGGGGGGQPGFRRDAGRNPDHAEDRNFAPQPSAPQHRVVVVPEARILPERVRHRRQRLLQVRPQHLRADAVHGGVHQRQLPR